MRLTPLVLAALLLGATALVFAPAAEARQACVYGDSDPCDDQLVCVWNRLTSSWDCYVRIDPCWFRCW